jgi:predicted AAA+ superfamily ATPase
MFTRALVLPEPGSDTFFLWGPRQSGKTTLLRAGFTGTLWVDLLKADEFRRYATRPESLRQELNAAPHVRAVVIDEVQKVPPLLDEVHWLMENRKVAFALCGSSARKVRKGHANLLGGRAIRYELFGLTASELAGAFDLTRLLNHGYLPRMFQSERPKRLLHAYVGDYLKEEVAAEGLVRNLPAFSTFLEVAALGDAEIINSSTIARECGVSSHTVQSYFEILVDTLLGRWLPAYVKRPKRRIVQSPKFYFSDVGVVNILAKRNALEPGNALFGKAFENWVHHELVTYNAYRERDATLSYWRLTTGAEVDFVVDDLRAAVEAKASRNVTADDLKGLRQLRADQPRLGSTWVVSLEPKRRRTEDGITILPVKDFIRGLWAGEIF